jgi:hypothetical protein
LRFFAATLFVPKDQRKVATVQRRKVKPGLNCRAKFKPIPSVSKRFKPKKRKHFFTLCVKNGPSVWQPDLGLIRAYSC